MIHLPSLPKSRRGRILVVILLVVALFAAAAGIFFWIRHINYLRSPEYAVDSLNEAIQTRDAELFNTVFSPDVSKDFAFRLTEVVPPDFLPQREPEKLAGNIQALLQSLLAGTPAPAFVKESLLPILPEDFFQQLAEKPFSLTKVNGSLAVAETSFHHPSCKDDLKITLAFGPMEKRWIAVGVLNAHELLTTYLSALNEERQRLEKLNEDKQEFHLRKLAYFLPNLTCKAGPMRLNGGFPVLVLNLTGDANPGPEIVEGWGLEFPVSDDAGNIMMCPRLSESGKIMPGNALQRSWTLELDEDTFLRMEKAGELTCKVVPLYVLLDNGTMYSNDPRWLERAGHTTNNKREQP